jgi:hypothetical protein
MVQNGVIGACETNAYGFEDPLGWRESTLDGPGVADCVASYGAPQVRHFRVEADLGEVAFFEIEETVPWTLVRGANMPKDSSLKTKLNN